MNDTADDYHYAFAWVSTLQMRGYGDLILEDTSNPYNALGQIIQYSGYYRHCPEYLAHFRTKPLIDFLTDLQLYIVANVVGRHSVAYTLKLQ
jgi:hypothetical protein